MLKVKLSVDGSLVPYRGSSADTDRDERRPITPMMSISMAALFLLACTAVVDGSMRIPSAALDSPLAGLDLYTTTVTAFIGPQPGDPNTTCSGPVVLYTEDLCKPTSLRAPGAIILATTEATLGGCSHETRYLSLFATDAAAVIYPTVDMIPSLNTYSSDGCQGCRTRHLPMMYLRIGPSSDVYRALISNGPGQNATVSPDNNVWQDVFASWQYQLFIRILPSALLIVSGAQAAVYFAYHMRILNADYRNSVTEGRRSFLRLVKFIGQSFDLPHAVLAIEMVTATLSGVVLAIGGYYSTPNLPFPVVEYFITVLSGWSSASSMLSASVWMRHVSPFVVSNALLTRILRGDYPVVFVLLTTMPIVIDTASSVLLAMYYNPPIVATVVSVIIFLVQLTVGVHVLFGVLHFHWTVRQVQEQTSRAAGHLTPMDTILRRLSRCALGMALSMLMICTGTLLMAVSTFMFTPWGWTTCFSLSYSGRALDSAFRVAMFKPRLAKSPSKPNTVVAVAPTSKTSNQQQQQQ